MYDNQSTKKISKTVLHDLNFQEKTLNSEKMFNVDMDINAGYYPQIKFNKCMPNQEYVSLPSIKDEDLPDILSTEVNQKQHQNAIIKVNIYNPAAETIQNIIIENLTSKIISQSYSNGKSEVIIEVSNPIQYLSRYSIISFTTKGAYNIEYTREYKEGEQAIEVDFYKELYTIDDWKDINKFLNQNYILMNDLDFSNQGNSIKINSTFSGTIDGNNHHIKNIFVDGIVIGTFNGKINNLYVDNLKCNGNNGNYTYLGFIAYATAGAEIDNLHIKDVEISLTERIEQDFIRGGGLVGYLVGSTVKNSSVNNIKINIY